MASNRDATMIVTSFIQSGNGDGTWTEERVKEKIKMWRKWFYVNIYDTTPDEQLKQEAKEATNSVPF